MKSKSEILVVIASLVLFVSLAYARGGTQQGSMENQQNGAGAGGQQTTTQQQMEQQQALTQDSQTVSQIQQALTAQGYNPGAVDGKWKSETESALRAFQQAQGIQATGQLDQQTLASLGVQGGAAAGGQQDMSSRQQSGQQGGTGY